MHSYEAIRQAITALAQPERAAVLARYFRTGPGEYAEGDQFLGLTMPQQHALAKQCGQLPTDETERLVRDELHECRMTGLLIWVYQAKKASRSQQELLMERYLLNRTYVNHWDLVDVSCPHLVGNYLLSETDQSVLYELVREDRLWSQRIAIISTFPFIRKGQFADTFALAEQLLTHKHDLIHKATGWMLREVGKRNGDALEEFLHDHIQQMPRTTLRYAIERFEPSRRNYYLKL